MSRAAPRRPLGAPLVVLAALAGCNLVTGADDIAVTVVGGASGAPGVGAGGSATSTGSGGDGAFGPAPGPECGNGACEAGEDCERCPADCDPCAASCGNGICDPDETCTSCPSECGACPSVCGDSNCEAPAETCTSCPADCGACPPVCGDGNCEAPAETCTSCPADCACAPVCGDGNCEAPAESCTSCPADCGACPPVCGDGNCEEPAESCTSCPADCGACPVVTHETEFLTWNLHNNAGCVMSNGVAKWLDRDDGPGALSIRDVLAAQSPAILALQEDGKLGPDSCSIGTVKNLVAGWLSGTHDVRSTDDVGASVSGERYGLFIRSTKYRFIDAGYAGCSYNGNTVRGFLWAEVDLVTDSTSNHFYVLNAHFKAGTTAADSAERTAQAQCVISWVAARKASHPNRAHFLLGDLNSGPDHNNDAYGILTGPGGPFENTSTADIQGINTHGDHWIDHVLGTKGNFTKAGYGSWTVGEGSVQNGGTLSDHLGLRTRIGHLQ